MIRGRGAQAMTLVELLAVVALLAAATAATLGVAGPLSAGHARDAAVATLAEALARGRHLAESRGGATLRLGETLVVAPVSGDPAEFRSRLPRGWRASLPALAEEDLSTGVIVFGPDGAAADSVIALRGPGGAKMHIRALGISGHTAAAEGATPR